MSVSSLIKRHHAIRAQLMEAIQNNDDEAVAAADQRLSDNLMEILNVEPTDGNSKIALLEFYLSILKPEFERSSVDKKVCARLSSMCGEVLNAAQE